MAQVFHRSTTSISRFTIFGALFFAVALGWLGDMMQRFINVVPDMQVRQALERMERPPNTPIDRAMATEIALREHARAVIVPSVTQSGRMLRLSAEIVDPQRGRTVWVQTSDADGPDTGLHPRSSFPVPDLHPREVPIDVRGPRPPQR